MNYLPGRATTIEYRQKNPRGGPVLLLLAAALAAAWYLTPKVLPTSAVKAEPKKTAVALPTAYAEDLQHHLESAEAALAAAVQNIRRSQEHSRRVWPALQREYLGLERSRLQAADKSSEAAHRSIEQARQELEIAKNLLVERTRK